ncbi:MAG: cysteate synthase [Candidatus Hodarchaeota archaeon]
MGDYRIICPQCKKEFSGYALSCECFSLLRTEYSNSLNIQALPGLWRFLDWLPCKKPLDTQAGSVTFRSSKLAKELGLKNLFIAFTGYWPEKRAYNLTGSFKDLESNPTIARAQESGIKALAIASAGNTARAFAHLANKTGFDVYLVVPKSCLDKLWTPEPSTSNVHLFTVDGDYCSTIEVTAQFCQVNGITPEGGAKNVARRDGMGTVMLDGAFTVKRLPDHYFQAIGSGTGAISCWEMADRLKANGWKGNPALHLSQNHPFIPIVKAWQAGRREILPEDMVDPEESIRKMHAVVLSNRHPPYAIGGGVYDALTDTQGKMYSVNNAEAQKAGKLFEALEEIDLVPAAEVVVASLLQAVEAGTINKTDHILLNVTGGGLKRLKEDFGFFEIEPEGTLSFDNCSLNPNNVY